MGVSFWHLFCSDSLCVSVYASPGLWFTVTLLCIWNRVEALLPSKFVFTVLGLQIFMHFRICSVFLGEKVIEMIWIALHPVATFANMGIFVLIHEYGMSFLLFLSSLVLEILLIFIKTDFHIIG